MTQISNPGPPRTPGRRGFSVAARVSIAAFLTAVGSCVVPPQVDAPPEAVPDAVVLKPLGPAHAQRHMIAAANPLAARAGLDILRAGGSAVDAAIAAQMVLNLVEPQSSGIGGGGFLMHYAAESGAIDAYDGRETAPAAASPTMFLDDRDKPRKFHDVVPGGLSVGVPGLLRMLEMAHGEHGRLPWAKLFEPAIELAERGFAVSPRLNRLIAGDRHLKTFEAARAYFHDSDGQPLAVGARLTNTALAETFRRIAERGADALHTGPIAADIVRTVGGAMPNRGGLLEADLAAYRARKREPVCLFYRKWLVCGMPPPSSGGITTLQILGILQRFDMAALKAGSARAVHLIAEASRLAFADRNIYVADDDFIPVPTAGLLDPGYLDLRARDISARSSMGTAFPGMPGAGAHLRLAPDVAPRGVSTTHLSVIDENGNAVAMTSSIENAFGSRLMVRGFLLNNQLTDFSFAPEKDGAPVANRAEAGKRPRSSMAPTLVFDGTGKAVMAVGSPGGSRIIGYVAKTIVATLDWELDMQKAIDLPHFINRNGRTDLEEGTAVEALKDELEALGHEISIRSLNSGLHGIRVTPTGLTGGADRRREGVAVGD